MTTLKKPWNYFFDDIIAGINNYLEYEEALENIFKYCYKYQLTIHIAKSDFYVDEVSLLGYNISYNSITANIKSKKKILNLSKPTNVKELQSLLGIINYHRKFIKDLAKIAAPLNKLLRKKIIVEK